MKEIKFRAWDNQKKAWITEPVGFTMSVVDGKFHVFGFNDAFADMYQIRVELQQYTGLKDKNGKEIYEGDIVRKVPEEWPSKSDDEARTLEEYLKSMSNIYEVSYQNDRFALFNEYGYRDRLSPGLHGSLEVIGNIYENPELLK